MVDIERFSAAARFTREAVCGGAHFAPPTENAPKPETWERNVDITLTYLFGVEEGKDSNRYLSLEDVGEIFPGKNGRPLTRQRVRQIVTKTVFDLWQNSLEDLQTKYQWERLKAQIGKPGFLTTKEGTTRNILEDLDRGADYKFLSKKYSGEVALRNARKILGKYGIVIPSHEPTFAPLIKELEAVGPDTDSDTLKKLQGEVDYSFMNNYREVFDLYFISFSPLLRKIGFYFRSEDIGIFLGKLGEAGIDVGHVEQQVHSGPQKGKLNHYFVFRLLEERIREVLLPDPELSNFLENPVLQIAGVRLSKLPNTTQLNNPENYQAVLSLCRQLKIKVGGSSSVGIDQLLEGCPVSVFERECLDDRRDKLHRRLYYPSIEEELFKGFLLQKAKRLRLVKPA